MTHAHHRFILDQSVENGHLAVGALTQYDITAFCHFILDGENKGAFTFGDNCLFRDQDRLIFALETVSNVRTQLAPDIELYWKQQAELEELVASFNKALRQARVAIIAWSRAHQRLASGITDPAEIDILVSPRRRPGIT